MNNDESIISMSEARRLAEAGIGVLAIRLGHWFLEPQADQAELPGCAPALNGYLQQLALLAPASRIRVLRAMHKQNPAAAERLGELVLVWNAGDVAGFDSGYEYAIHNDIGELPVERAMQEDARRLAEQGELRIIRAA